MPILSPGDIGQYLETFREGAPGIKRVEARDATEHPTALYSKELFGSK